MKKKINTFKKVALKKKKWCNGDDNIQKLVLSVQCASTRRGGGGGCIKIYEPTGDLRKGA